MFGGSGGVNQPIPVVDDHDSSISNLDGLSNFITLGQPDDGNEQQMLIVNPTELEHSFMVPPPTAGQFSCNQSGCDKSYATVTGLNNHIKKYNNAQYEREKKNEYTILFFLYRKHSGMSSLYPCDECAATFSATNERTMHKIQQHEGRRYQTQRHGQTNAVAKFQCTQCDKSFSKAANLKKHGVVHTKTKNTAATMSARDDDVVAIGDVVVDREEDRVLHRCETCDDVFNQKGDLVRHMRNRHTGSGEYPCPECSKVFYTFDMYREHRSLHDDSVPKHTCGECGKQFISVRKLKEHSIIHQERIMFKCDVCSKVFVRSQTLQYHRITCKAAYSCDKCVDSFMTAEALARHQQFHSADNFACVKCNKVFHMRQALANHEKRHSLRMNYTCQICKATISTRAKFQKHIKDHLGKIAFIFLIV